MYRFRGLWLVGSFVFGVVSLGIGANATAAGPATVSVAETTAGAAGTVRGQKLVISDIASGMTVDQVRQLLRTQTKLDYKEYPTHFTFQTQTGEQAVPGGDFIAVVDAADYIIGQPKATPGDDIYIAHFTGRYDGAEHLYKLTHYFRFAPGKEIHESTLLASLRDKYGEPSYVQPRPGIGTSGYVLVWTSTSAPVSGLLEASQHGTCYPQIGLGLGWGMPSNTRVIAPPVPVVMFSMYRGLPAIAACGDYLVVAVAARGGLQAAPETTLISGYTSLLVSPDIVTKGLAHSQSLLAAAKAGADKASIQQAQKEKGPQL